MQIQAYLVCRLASFSFFVLIYWKFAFAFPYRMLLRVPPDHARTIILCLTTFVLYQRNRRFCTFAALHGPFVVWTKPRITAPSSHLFIYDRFYRDRCPISPSVCSPLFFDHLCNPTVGFVLFPLHSLGDKESHINWSCPCLVIGISDDCLLYLFRWGEA